MGKKNSKNTNNGSGLLDWNKETDHSFASAHDNCDIEGFDVEPTTKFIEKVDDKGNSSFFKREIRTFKFKNCKPTTQSNNQTIDKDHRIFLDRFEVESMVKQEKIDPNDPSLDTSIQKNLLNTRISTLDNLISKTQDQKSIQKWKEEKDKITKRLGVIEQGSQGEIGKQLFGGV